MLKLLKSIFARCPHMWKEYHRENIVRSVDKAPVGWASLCQCEKCGERRLFKMVL